MAATSVITSLVQHGETPYLPPNLRRGLVAMSVVSMVSLVLTTTLFTYITYRLIHWKIWRYRERRRHQIAQNTKNNNNTTANYSGGNGGQGNGQPQQPSQQNRILSMDLSLGLSPTHIRNLKRKSLNFLSLDGELSSPNTTSPDPAPPARPDEQPQEPQPLNQEKSNPILILIYNLLWADVQMSMSFVLSLSWLRQGQIPRRNSTCWAQGWLLTAGLLAVSCFLIVISFIAYFAVCKKGKNGEGRSPTRRWLYLSVVAVWVFSYAMGWAGVLITKNGGDGEGWFVSVGAWCWINPRYTMLRIYLEYLWIFLSVLVTIVLYSLIVLSAYRKGHLLEEISPIASKKLDDEGEEMNPFSSSSSPTPTPGQQSEGAKNSSSLKTSGHHPAFMIYPVIYIICTAPLTFGRVAEFLNHPPSIEFWSFAGVLAASHGWMNVVLWSTIVLVIGPSEAKRTGLDRFAFSLKTPKGRKYGNMVWVEGGDGNGRGDEENGGNSKWGRWGWGWLSEKVLGDNGDGGRGRRGGGGEWKSSSQEELRQKGSKQTELGIQMEVVTTVVVEDDDGDSERGIDARRARLGTGHSSTKGFE